MFGLGSSIYREYGFISKDIRRFARSMKKAGEPVVVPLSPEPWAIIRECYANCAEMCKRQGGEVIYGWHVYAIPRVFLEAEAHAVWKKPTGELVEVTPNDVETPTIAFIPDASCTWVEGVSRPIPNRYYPLSRDNRIQEYIRLATQRAELHAALYSGGGSAPLLESYCVLSARLEALMRAILK